MARSVDMQREGLLSNDASLHGVGPELGLIRNPAFMQHDLERC